MLLGTYSGGSYSMECATKGTNVKFYHHYRNHVPIVGASDLLEKFEINDGFYIFLANFSE